MSQWKPISELPQIYFDTRRMFVVRAVRERWVAGVQCGEYITDPWCVWHNGVLVQPFVRWPHPFPPTEFLELPE